MGISADLKSLYQPDHYDAGGYADIMSYCWPQHVSDYSFIKAQDYLELHPPKAFTSGVSVRKKFTSVPEEKSLYISGEISASGSVALRRIIPVKQGLGEAVSGDYKIKVIGKNAEHLEQSFDVKVLDHATKESPQFFSVRIPIVEIASVEIFYKGASIFKQVEFF